MILHLICFQPAWIVSIVFVQTKQKRYNQLNHPLLYLWIEKIDGHLYRQSNFLWMEFRWINHTLQGFNYNLIQLLYLELENNPLHCESKNCHAITIKISLHEWMKLNQTTMGMCNRRSTKMMNHIIFVLRPLNNPIIV